ncbi:CPBP family intramembrane glutamic endopeptidase [Blastococcus sp. Marseille-P5729]|uniref:CPBP family intramembrane glutamic endopeptidase n=1 Tax=Blastococcus sp. Marseille-P5729 TaxID=2086582 RepID=UPI000D0F2B0D|nr:CPBP family intramembrane glutamic endopeptidase [Blastococcus sp. Marseille-P5729]
MIDRSVVPGGLPDFGSATAAALIITGYLIVAEPFVGLVLHRRFEAAERRVDSARRWLYRRLLILEWALAGLCLATVALAPAVSRDSVGIRLPTGWPGILGSVAAIGLALAVLLATSRQATRVPIGADLPTAGEGVLAMLPRTPVERRLFAIVSVTAGLCEELVFRGFLVAVLAAVLPAAPVWVCVVGAAVVFALAHLYQGAPGVVVTFFVGLALGGLYIVTGSLLAPVLVHALIDLRAISLGRLVVGNTARDVARPGRI